MRAAPAATATAPLATQLEELSSDEILRYSRHLILPEVALEGQQRLKASRVLLIGAGGLGSPLALYLTAAHAFSALFVDEPRERGDRFEPYFLGRVLEVRHDVWHLCRAADLADCAHHRRQGAFVASAQQLDQRG